MRQFNLLQWLKGFFCTYGHWVFLGCFVSFLVFCTSVRIHTVNQQKAEEEQAVLSRDARAERVEQKLDRIIELLQRQR